MTGIRGTRRFVGIGLVLWLVGAATVPLWHDEHTRGEQPETTIHVHSSGTYLCESTSHVVHPGQPCAVCSTYRLLAQTIGEEIRPCEEPHLDAAILTVQNFAAVSRGRSSSPARAPPLS